MTVNRQANEYMQLSSMNEPTNLTQLNEDILYENYHLDPKRSLSIVIHFLCIEMIIGSFAKERKRV
jgi:hypothetical protein